MSIQGFVEKFSEDTNLQTELGEVLSNADDTNVDRRVVELGERHGFTFSEEDSRNAGLMLSMTNSSDGELSDEQLELVSGGFGGHINWSSLIRKPIVKQLQQSITPTCPW